MECLCISEHSQAASHPQDVPSSRLACPETAGSTGCLAQRDHTSLDLGFEICLAVWDLEQNQIGLPPAYRPLACGRLPVQRQGRSLRRPAVGI